MRVKKTNDGVSCLLSQPEINKLLATSEIIGQFAYFYRETEFGDRCREFIGFLDSIFVDEELVDPRMKGAKTLEEVWSQNSTNE